MASTVLIIVAYLLGSIPFAYIAGRAFKGLDIRKVGDGNAGAANVFREISPLAGLLVMLADVLKGTAAVLLAQAYGSQLTAYLAGIAAVAGHCWPIFLRFKGGRGEATAGGVLVALFPVPMAILVGIAIIPFLITRNTMLLGAMLFAPLWLAAWLTGSSPAQIAYSIGLPILVGVNHFITTRHLSAETKKRGLLMR